WTSTTADSRTDSTPIRGMSDVGCCAPATDATTGAANTAANAPRICRRLIQPAKSMLATEAASIHRPPCGDRPELLDAVGADADLPGVQVDGRVAVAGDEADLVAEREAVGGGRDREAAVLVGGALVGGGRFVADQRRAGVEGERLEAGVDDGA